MIYLDIYIPNSLLSKIILQYFVYDVAIAYQFRMDALGHSYLGKWLFCADVRDRFITLYWEKSLPISLMGVVSA